MLYKSVLEMSVRMYFFYQSMEAKFGVLVSTAFFHGIVEGKLDLPKNIEDQLTAKVLNFS